MTDIDENLDTIKKMLVAQIVAYGEPLYYLFDPEKISMDVRKSLGDFGEIITRHEKNVPPASRQYAPYWEEKSKYIRAESYMRNLTQG